MKNKTKKQIITNLFKFKDMLNKELLKVLVAVVDTQLLKTRKVKTITFRPVLFIHRKLML